MNIDYGQLGPSEEQKAQMEMVIELRKLEKKLDGVNTGILEVEQHIVDKMKTEAGASNMKLWAEALEIVRKMERRQ